MHQLMTINAIFIYCLIPVFSGFSQYIIKNILKKKIIKYFFDNLNAQFNYLLLFKLCSQ